MKTITLNDIYRVREDAGLVMNVKLENIDPDKPYSEEGLDSLDRIALFFELESAFNVEIPYGEVAVGEWDTLNKVVAKLNELVNK